MESIRPVFEVCAQDRSTMVVIKNRGTSATTLYCFRVQSFPNPFPQALLTALAQLVEHQQSDGIADR